MSGVSASLPAPKSKRTARLARVAGAVVLLVLVAWVVVTIVDRVWFGPDRVVRDYLEALQKGEIEQALQLGHVTADPGGRALLQPAVVKTVRPSDVSVRSVVRSGDKADVQVLYRAGGRGVGQGFALHKDGPKGLLFSKWELYPVVTRGLTVRSHEVSAVSINGVSLPLNADGELVSLALPGTYAATASDPHGLLTFDESSFDLESVGRPEMEYLDLQSQASPKFTAEVDLQIAAFLSACAAQRAPAPQRCPFRYQGQGVVTSPHWKVASLPHANLARSREDGSWTFETLAVGVVHFTGVRRENGLRTPVAVDQKVAVSGSAAIVDGKVIITIVQT